MGEVEQEIQGEPETTEEMAAEQPDDDEQPEQGEPEPEPDDEPSDEQERLAELAARADSEKARKKRDEQLDGEKERHAKRVGQIMGEAAVDLIPCPVCMDGIDGWVFVPEVQQLPPEAISRIRQVIGLPDYSSFRPARDAQECPDCEGLGEVITGSHVPGYETKDCGRCAKRGWVPVAAPPTTNGHVDPAAPEVTGPTVYGVEETPDEVRRLRERGFTVIPPMSQVAG
jgi:hypothetical protein